MVIISSGPDSLEMESSERHSNHVTTRSENEEKKPAARDSKNATTDFETFVLLLKSSLGSGLLATPDAFKNAGLGLGIAGTAVVVLFITHAYAILVRSSQYLCYKLKIPFLTYYETAEYAFKHGNIPAVRAYSGFARKFVKVFLFITYIGANSAYFVFIASTAKQVTEAQTGIHWNIRWYILLALTVVLPLGVIKPMKLLAPFSAAASVCLFGGLGIILYKIMGDLPPISSRPMVAPLDKLSLSLATILCGCEGIGTLLPAENEMKHPDHLLGLTGVLSFAMFIVGTVTAAVGFIGYLKFGDAVAGSISLNLENDWLSELVKVLIALAILLTYGLQMTVAAEIVWDNVKKYFQKNKSGRAYYYVRASLIVATGIVAAVIPNLAPIISLQGAIGFSILGLFCPAVIDLVLFYDPVRGLADFRFWKNIIFITASLLSAALGTYASLADIIANYE